MTKTGNILGFTCSSGLSMHAEESKLRKFSRLLENFSWLNSFSLTVGATNLDLWGHGELKKCVYRAQNGDVIVLVGVPQGNVSLQQTYDSIDNESFRLPWDGQVILIKVSGDGKQWTMWNDWVGSIPVFHAKVDSGRIASTLEPVVVAVGGYLPNDFFIPGLVSLLINGHYIGDWTLFKQMRIVPADCRADWEDEVFRWKRLWTVKPTDTGWTKGRDDLINEMYRLSSDAVSGTIEGSSSWILPLSGGLDSRLIAAVCANVGTEVKAYTYGAANCTDVVYARQIAKVLNIDWKWIPIESDYLKKYTRLWFDWFGSSLHCHGMYQMPFLEALKKGPIGILHGYMGDSLTGGHPLGLISTHTSSSGIQPAISRKKVFWPAQELKELLLFDAEKYIDIVREKIKEEIEQVPGARYQQLMFLDFWNRQRPFIYYQPMMWSYYKKVATPFMNRAYARFCLSLPRCVLDGRLLQKEMFRHYYPKVARIPCTDKTMIGFPGGRFLFKQRIARYLPKHLLRGPFREFGASCDLFGFQVAALKSAGDEGFWPLNAARHRREEFFNFKVFEQVYQQARVGNTIAYNRLRCLQAISIYFTEK